MNLYDFIKLSQAQRAEQVFLTGTLLATCEERGILYHMGEFYAEVVYDDDRNEIREVRGFKTLNNLDPYLKDIDVSTDL